jgi:N-acetylneuraminate synthase
MDFFARKYAFGEDDPTVVIGEIGVNHNGDPQLARRLVDVAAAAGVDIVKFQVFKAEKEISRFAALAPYQRETSHGAANQLELCKALELSPSDLRDLKQRCAAADLGFLCSVFDFDSVDFLVDDLKVEAIKIGSGEITNLPFLEYVGSRKCGVILSTGASTLAEVGEAVAALRRGGTGELVLLHCVSSYPAPNNELNLRAMQTLKMEFRVPTGFSDHSVGFAAAAAATSLGAVVIEKHFTIDRNLPGPDHRASADPEDLRRLVETIRAIDSALGDGVKRPMPCELANQASIRRSLVARGTLKAGDRLTESMVDIKRPAGGIEPKYFAKVIGRVLRRNLEDDEPITWESLN